MAEELKRTEHERSSCWTRQEVRLTLLQLSLMFSSGVGLLKSLETLRETVTENKRGELDSIIRSLERGHRLSTSFKMQKSLFPRTVIELIYVGEETGALSQALSKAADWMETQEQLRKNLVSVLSYPVAVIAVATIVNLVILKCCLPQLLDMLESSNIELPWLSRIVFGLGMTLVDVRFLLLVQGLAILLWVGRKNLFSEPRLLKLEQVALRLPYLSPLLRSIAQARIAHTMSLGLATGIDTLKTVEIALNASGSRVYKGAVEKVKILVQNGSSLSEAFRYQETVFQPLFCQYLEAGEQTGRTAETCRALAKQMEQEFEYRTAVLAALMEPLLLALSSLFVGMIVIATFLPLQQFIKNIL